MDLLEILQSANLALKILQARILTLIAMILFAVLLGWAMVIQTWLGVMIATLGGILLFLPVLFTGRGGHDGSQIPPRAPQHAAAETQPE